MKHLLKDPFFCGIITLQIAAISWFCGPAWGEGLTVTVVHNWWAQARLEQSSLLPEMVAYGKDGYRQPLLGPNTKTLVLSGTCSCDELAVESSLNIAQSRGEEPTLLIPLLPSTVKPILYPQWRGRTLFIRLSELQVWGILETSVEGQLQIPLLLHLNNNRKTIERIESLG
jgi:hypothetical protein